MLNTLSLQQAPPLSVPARFFLTAPLFGVAAAMITLLNNDILVSRWTPAMLAVTHCLVLGFFTMVMIGALQQLLPVVAGAVITRPRLFAGVIWSLWVPGSVLLVSAFLSSSPAMFLAATVLLTLAVLIFVAVVVQALWRGASVNESVAGIRFAVLALLVTLVLGAALGAGYAGIIPLWRFPLTNLHLSWGLIGWIGLLVMTIAWQVVPMFQITPAYPNWLRRSTIPVVFSLLLAKSLLIYPGFTSVHKYLGTMADLLLGIFLVGFALVTLSLQGKAQRRIRDSHRNYWRLAMINLVVAAGFWIAAEITGQPQYDMLAGVAFLLGFAMAVVIGMLVKIVSFLVWLHLQAINDNLIMAGGRGIKVPGMKGVIPPRINNYLLVLVISAELVLLGAVILPVYLLQVAALLWMAVFILLGYIIASALYRYHGLRRKHIGTPV